MPYQPIGKYEGSRGFARKTDFKRPVTFYDRVRFVGDDSTMEIFGGVLSGDISADLITLGTLDAARIAVGSLDGDKITTGTMEADKITVGTITANRLILGSLDNLIQDPGAETGDSVTDSVHDYNDGGAQGWVVNTSTSTSRSGNFYWFYVHTSQSSPGILVFNGSRGTPGNHVATTEGEEFYFSYWAKRTAVGTAGRVYAQLVWNDEDGNELSATPGAVITLTDTWQLIKHSATAPANTTNVVFRAVVETNNAAVSTRIDDAYARRMIGTLVIEDQAVDIERMLDPVFVDGDEDKTSVTVKSGGQTDVHTTSTITVPSWVGSLTVFAVGMFHNRWGFSQRIDLYVKIAGGPATQATNTDVIANETNGLIGADAKNISSPGSTVLVQITGGTSSNDELTVNVQSVYTATGLR